MTPDEGTTFKCSSSDSSAPLTPELHAVLTAAWSVEPREGLAEAIIQQVIMNEQKRNTVLMRTLLLLVITGTSVPLVGMSMLLNRSLAVILWKIGLGVQRLYVQSLPAQGHTLLSLTTALTWLLIFIALASIGYASRVARASG